MNYVAVINGTYGIGKTSVANIIAQNDTNNFVMMDPDEYYNQLAKKGATFFIGWPMQNSKIYLMYFRCKVEKALEGSNVIIPITISTDVCKKELYDYFESITDIVHIVLHADEDVVIKRIENDVGRSKEFSKEKLEGNMVFIKKHFSDANWIDTTTKSIEEVVNHIIPLLR